MQSLRLGNSMLRGIWGWVRVSLLILRAGLGQEDFACHLFGFFPYCTKEKLKDCSDRRGVKVLTGLLSSENTIAAVIFLHIHINQELADTWRCTCHLDKVYKTPGG